MAKDIWQSLLITHQGNSQVKDNKIDLLVQQYEQFTILEEESIDSGFARFNTIITSLKALDEGKKERINSIALKAKKESSDDETLTFRSDDEEYAMTVRNFKKFFRKRENLFGNQEKKGSHSDKWMRRKERLIGNVLDAVIQVISLAIVQIHISTKIKRLSLEVLGVIARMTPKTKPTTKLVSWLNRQM
nr:UBN2 domain-containing protein [Tanacetum cinerariifolium]